MTEAQLREWKARAAARIDAARDELCDLSRMIQAHPEVAYQEFQAAAWLCDYLQAKGFAIERGIGGLPTAFSASVHAPKTGPVLAILAEYDALPAVGHGCGHNLLGVGAVGAGLGVAAVMPELAGVVQVVGTPAEECTDSQPGKVLMLEAGVFKNVDASITFHPMSLTGASLTNLGFMVLDIGFRGRSAHAAADPWNGLNALDAVMLAYAGISALRQQTKPDARIHCIITRGGESVNVIPQWASMRVMFRSPDVKYLEEMRQRIEACARGAAASTGTEPVITLVTNVQGVLHNSTLYELTKTNMGTLGLDLALRPVGPASTDFGNISRAMPSFSFTVKTHEPTNWHSKEVADTAVSDLAHDGMILAAKAMAMTAIDLLARPDMLDQAKKDYRSK